MCRRAKTITVNDQMQQDYTYKITTGINKNFSDKFKPHFSPKQMLSMGVFEGKYCNDCKKEFPQDWFTNALLSATSDISINYFGIKSRQPLSVWREKGWIIGPDPRGWFQWYCRYFLGRRLPDIDLIQIKRWRAFARHSGQIRKNCTPGVACRVVVAGPAQAARGRKRCHLHVRISRHVNLLKWDTPPDRAARASASAPSAIS